MYVLTHMADRIAPRPGVEVHQVLIMVMRQGKEFEQKELGEIESGINMLFTEFSEESFRVEAEQPKLVGSELSIKTERSTLQKDQIEEIIDFVQDDYAVNVISWEVEGLIERKSFGPV